MKRSISCVALGLLISSLPAFSMTMEERRQYLEKLQQILPDVPCVQAVARQDRRTASGFRCAAARQRPARPAEVPGRQARADGRRLEVAPRGDPAALSRNTIWARFPPKPKLDRAVVLDETPGKGYLIRNVRLEFGPGSKGTHARAGDDSRWQGSVSGTDGPEPGRLGAVSASPRLHLRGICGQRRHGRRGRPGAALSRLRFCVDPAPGLGRAPGSGLSGDAASSRHEARRLFGYSRDGKMAAIAAALDDRIAAVIPGSTGVGGVLPWRLVRRAQLRRRHREHHAQSSHLVRSASALLLRPRGSPAHRRAIFWWR